MKLSNTICTTALASALVLVLGTAFTPTVNADTVAGNTAFKVILQPITVLDYYSEIDLTIDSSAIQALLGSGLVHGTSAITASAGGTGLTATTTSFSPGGSSLSAVNLDISKAYAVRSITTPSSGNTTVTVNFTGGATTATLTGTTNSSSTIPLSNPGTSLVSFSGTGLNPANAKSGDISMTMDLSKATSADTYAGATIVITATST